MSGRTIGPETTTTRRSIAGWSCRKPFYYRCWATSLELVAQLEGEDPRRLQGVVGVVGVARRQGGVGREHVVVEGVGDRSDDRVLGAVRPPGGADGGRGT